MRRLLHHDGLLMALQVPLRQPGRSALTTLGLAIGVASFIAMVSFGRGARGSVVAQFETLGSNLLRIKPAYERNPPPRPLDDNDVKGLTRQSTTLQYVIPYALATVDVTAGSRRVRLGVSGTVPEYIETRGWRIGQGSLFDHADDARRAKVCVLGATTAANLFGNAEAVGQSITVAGKLPCHVIGVLAPLGISISGGDLDNTLLMPLNTFATHLGLPSGLTSIEARPTDRALLDAAKQEVIAILRRTHQIGPEKIDDFHVSSPDDVTRVVDSVGSILTGLLGGIAAISLLVGGIGIMNIQLVSVAERTHEIGIRAAIGASPEQIERQFIAEAIVLAVLGSAAGVALGVLLSFLVARQLHWPYATTLDIVLGAAAFGIAVGAVFGYLPARRAARLDPVEALRRE
jgi:putative ABC transport system permease protein